MICEEKYLNGVSIQSSTVDILGKGNSPCKGFKAEMWLICSRHDRNTRVPGLKWSRYTVLENKGKTLAEVWPHRSFRYVTLKCYSKCDPTRLELLKQPMIFSFLSFFFYNLASCIRPRVETERLGYFLLL